MGQPESKIQSYAATEFRRLGGLVRKIRYEGRNGCPDLLVLLPGGVVLFVEVKKAENVAPEAHQSREHKRMRRRGADVRVVGSEHQVDLLVAKFAAKR